MRSLKVLVIIPAWFVLAAASSPAPTLPPPSPIPSPSPTHAAITLDTAAGGATTRIGVIGYFFPPNATVTLYWDNPGQVAGSTGTNPDGYMEAHVVPFPGDRPGQHSLCGSAAGLSQSPPCATFTLQGPPTPTPAASPSPSAAPTASASPSPSQSASPVVLTTNSGRSGLDVITKPPFVFLPIIGLLAVLAALAYWLLMRVDRTPILPSAFVVHRSARPEIGPVAPRPPPSPPPAPTPPEMQPPPADLPPPAAPFDPTAETDAPAGSSELPEPPAY